jgi:hypothetical protein
MRVAEKLDWKGLKIKKSVGNRKIIMSDEDRKGLNRSDDLKTENSKVNCPSARNLAPPSVCELACTTKPPADTPITLQYVTIYCKNGTSFIQGVS